MVPVTNSEAAIMVQELDFIQASSDSRSAKALLQLNVAPCLESLLPDDAGSIREYAYQAVQLNAATTAKFVTRPPSWANADFGLRTCGPKDDYYGQFKVLCGTHS